MDVLSFADLRADWDVQTVTISDPLPKQTVAAINAFSKTQKTFDEWCKVGQGLLISIPAESGAKDYRALSKRINELKRLIANEATAPNEKAAAEQELTSLEKERATCMTVLKQAGTKASYADRSMRYRAAEWLRRAATEPLTCPNQGCPVADCPTTGCPSEEQIRADRERTAAFEELRNPEVVEAICQLLEKLSAGASCHSIPSSVVPDLPLLNAENRRNGKWIDVPTVVKEFGHSVENLRSIARTARVLSPVVSGP